MSLKALITAGVAAATIAGSTMAPTSSAEAGWHGDRGYNPYHRSNSYRGGGYNPYRWGGYRWGGGRWYPYAGYVPYYPPYVVSSYPVRYSGCYSPSWAGCNPYGVPFRRPVRPL